MLLFMQHTVHVLLISVFLYNTVTVPVTSPLSMEYTSLLIIGLTGSLVVSAHNYSSVSQTLMLFNDPVRSMAIVSDWNKYIKSTTFISRGIKLRESRQFIPKWNAGEHCCFLNTCQKIAIIHLCCRIISKGSQMIIEEVKIGEGLKL